MPDLGFSGWWERFLLSRASRGCDTRSLVPTDIKCKPVDGHLYDCVHHGVNTRHLHFVSAFSCLDEFTLAIHVNVDEIYSRSFFKRLLLIITKSSLLLLPVEVLNTHGVRGQCLIQQGISNWYYFVIKQTSLLFVQFSPGIASILLSQLPRIDFLPTYSRCLSGRR